MIPQLVLLEEPPEVEYLGEMFQRYSFPPSQLDKVLTKIVTLLQTKGVGVGAVSEWVDEFRWKEQEVGELLYRPLQVLGDSFYGQFLQWGMYLPDGYMPYEYAGRHDLDYLVMKLDIYYRMKGE